MITCKVCNVEKEDNSFYSQKTTCKDCIKEQRKEYYKNNESLIKSVNNSRYHEQIEYCRERQRRYYLANIPAHRERSYIQRHTRREVVPIWADREKIREIYKQARLEHKQVDHIIPLISNRVCGLHCEANLQLLSQKDNIRKGNRVWPDMWEDKI